LFLNTRVDSKKVTLLKALIRRLANHHPKKPLVESELNRRKAGLWGEREVDKKLTRLDQEKYHMICDLRLPNGDGTFFQIDTLVLSICFILIIESKNIAGTLYFDLTNHQFYRINENGERDCFDDPVSQARLHTRQLKRWLVKHKFASPPIDFFVTSTNPNSLFHISPQDHPIAKKICSISGLTWEIDNLEERYHNEVVTEKEIRKIGKALLKAHTPLQPSDILKQFAISTTEILTGVHCPQCEFLPLPYHVGKWYCPKCKVFFKDAHIGALDDHFQLVCPTITNAEFRRFLHFDHPAMASKCLKKMNLLAFGKNKGRYYRKN
jgi:hypothetical protein